MGTRRARQPAGSYASLELSSASDLLRGMRFPKSNYPGHRVVKEVRKGRGADRYIVFYSGKVQRSNKRNIARLAHDRGFDVSLQRFERADPAEKARMIAGSLQWQTKAKARWVGRMQRNIGRVKNPQKRQRLEAQLQRLEAVTPRSPLLGAKPVSAYLRRYWE